MKGRGESLALILDNGQSDGGHAADPTAEEELGAGPGDLWQLQSPRSPSRDSVTSFDSMYARMSTGGGPLRKEIRRLLRAGGVRLWDPPYLLEDGSPNYELLSDLCVTYAEELDSDDIEGIMGCLEHIQINAVMRQLERLGVDLQGQTSLSPPTEVPKQIPEEPPAPGAATPPTETLEPSPPPPGDAPPPPPDNLQHRPEPLDDVPAEPPEEDVESPETLMGSVSPPVNVVSPPPDIFLSSPVQDLDDTDRVAACDEIGPAPASNTRLLAYLGNIPTEAPAIPPRPPNTFERADVSPTVSPDWPSAPFPPPVPSETVPPPDFPVVDGGKNNIRSPPLFSPDSDDSESDTEGEGFAAVSYGAGAPVQSDSDSDGWGFDYGDEPMQSPPSQFSDSDDEELCIDDEVGPAGSAITLETHSEIDFDAVPSPDLADCFPPPVMDDASSVTESDTGPNGVDSMLDAVEEALNRVNVPEDGCTDPRNIDTFLNNIEQVLNTVGNEMGNESADSSALEAIPLGAPPPPSDHPPDAPPPSDNDKRVPPSPPPRTGSELTRKHPKDPASQPHGAITDTAAVEKGPSAKSNKGLPPNPSSPSPSSTRLKASDASFLAQGKSNPSSSSSPKHRAAQARRLAQTKSSVASMVKKTGRLQMATALTQTKQSQTTACRLKFHWYHITLKGNFLLLRKISQADRAEKLADLTVATAEKQYLIDGSLTERLSDCILTLALSSGDALQLQASGTLIASAWELALNRAAGVLEAKYSDPAECKKVLDVRIANHREALGKASDACTEAKDTTKHQLNAALWRYEMELLTIFRLEKYAAAVEGSLGGDSSGLIEHNISERTRGLLNELGSAGLNSSGLYLILGPNGTGRVKRPRRRSMLMGTRRQGSTPRRSLSLGKSVSPSGSINDGQNDAIPQFSATKGHLVKIFCAVDSTTVYITRELDMTAQGAIAAVVHRREDARNPRCWYLEEVLPGGARPLAPDDLVADGVSYNLYLRPVHDINMTRSHHSSFGFSLMEDVSGVVRVTNVEIDSIALVHGLRKGDEVLTINGEAVSGRLADAIDQLKSEIQASIQILPADELAVKASANKKREIDVMVTAMHLAPPPQHSEALGDDLFADLVLPSPEHFGLVNESTPTRISPGRRSATVDPSTDTEAILSELVSSSAETKVLSDEMRLLISKPAQKRWQLQARIEELVSTEAGYVKDLQTFMERFVEPALSESFIKKQEKAMIQACRFDKLIRFHETFHRALQLSLPENAPSKYNERARQISVSSAVSSEAESPCSNGLGFTQADLPAFSPPQGSDMSFVSVRADASYLSTISERQLSSEDDDDAECSAYDAVRVMKSFDRPEQSAEERALEKRGPGTRRRDLRASATIPPTNPTRVDDSPFVKVGASLFAVGDVFLASVHQLSQVYSDFITFRKPCAAILSAKRNLAFDAFLRNRNPGKDIAELVDWYMIKPVQRVTKYPLLLTAMTDALRKDPMFTGDVQPLMNAAEQMRNVVIHINEMQKVGEALQAEAPALLVRCTAKRNFATFLWINAIDDKGRAVRKSENTLMKVVVYPEHLVLFVDNKKEYRYIGMLEVKDAYFTTDLSGLSLTTKQLKQHKDTGWVLRPRDPNVATPGSVQQYAFACASPDDRRMFLHSLQLLMDSKAKEQVTRASSQSAFQV